MSPRGGLDGPRVQANHDGEYTLDRVALGQNNSPVEYSLLGFSGPD